MNQWRLYIAIWLVTCSYLYGIQLKIGFLRMQIIKNSVRILENLDKIDAFSELLITHLLHSVNILNLHLFDTVYLH